jgi:hypothetical protein
LFFVPFVIFCSKILSRHGLEVHATPERRGNWQQAMGSLLPNTFYAFSRRVAMTQA